MDLSVVLALCLLTNHLKLANAVFCWGCAWQGWMAVLARKTVQLIYIFCLFIFFICLQLGSFSRALGRNGLKQCVFCHHPKCCCAFEIWISWSQNGLCDNLCWISSWRYFWLTLNWTVCCVHLFFFQLLCPAQIGFWCVCSLCWLCASKCSHFWLFEAWSLAVVCVCSYC